MTGKRWVNGSMPSRSKGRKKFGWAVRIAPLRLVVGAVELCSTPAPSAGSGRSPTGRAGEPAPSSTLPSSSVERGAAVVGGLGDRANAGAMRVGVGELHARQLRARPRPPSARRRRCHVAAQRAGSGTRSRRWRCTTAPGAYRPRSVAGLAAARRRRRRPRRRHRPAARATGLWSRMRDPGCFTRLRISRMYSGPCRPRARSWPLVVRRERVAPVSASSFDVS